MAITKTDFIEYTRCPRYIALENIVKDKLDADVSYREYKEQELNSQLEEICSTIFDVDENGKEVNKTLIRNKQLEAMLPYYKKVEEEAGRIVTKMFGGSTIYAEKTQDQASFDFFFEGGRFLCYVDIYNEQEDGVINIVEVKATTSKKYTDLIGGHKKGIKYPIFFKQDNIYILKDEIEDYPLEKEMPLNVYQKQKEKLYDRFGIGSYIYDLAVQRFIIEGEYRGTLEEGNLQNIHYFLAVLNADYIFPGKYCNGKPVYETDEHGNELITLFQMDKTTAYLQKKIQSDAKQIIAYLKEPDASPCPLSNACGYKKQTCCKYFKEVCGSVIPAKNSSLSYVNNAFGFVREDGTRIKGLDLINEGYLDMLDVKEEWLLRKNHQIQYECYKNHHNYVNKEKIRAGLSCLEYPIYHLDFETFPCPVPRFKGEWPYIQSPFEFSLHIEYSPGVCDKQKDNIIFLAKTSGDEREDLITTLLEHIDVDKGTLLAQNVAFEKGRIKELAKIFPKYKDKLMKLYNRGFDLLWIINNNKEMYEKLNFKAEDVETFNFYDERLSGSFSIKKTLPLFSDLSYANLVVKNGTEAIVEYANYDRMPKEEFQLKYEALRIYCQQDTWAMVEILKGLRKLIQDE